MAQDYLPILVQVIFAAGFAGFALFLSVLIGRVGKRTTIKDTAYECGMLPEGEAQPRFSVKFYLVAMLFILFDIEIVFMYPWAVVYRDFVAKYNALPILGSMVGFIVILLVGFVYAVKKGALDWRR
ncbi:MAG: NADH-quinone oxidoreductase subunit A [Verrucomicrobia bacterium]|nr:NADH-quinone oxidoreductase subunit A [Verrucomicrobiota bacterium]MBV8484492.1 NADH-quinone oxidoreductase subunit A [Verrucomicrobiota bacterium]